MDSAKALIVLSSISLDPRSWERRAKRKKKKRKKEKEKEKEKEKRKRERKWDQITTPTHEKETGKRSLTHLFAMMTKGTFSSSLTLMIASCSSFSSSKVPASFRAHTSKNPCPVLRCWSLRVVYSC